MHIKTIIIYTFIALFVVITPFFITNYIVNNIEKYPDINKHFIKKINDKYYSDEQTGIFDMFTGSFKTFILNNNTPVLLEKLYKNLDEESKEKLDIAFNAILHVPDTSYMKYFYFKSSKFDADFRPKLNTFKSDKSFYEELPEIKKKYKLPEDALWIYGVFYDHHNLRFAPEKVRKYVQDKIFLDVGAYVGDSVLVLLNYNPRKIYSFEISNMNIKRFNETMKMNNVSLDKVELVNLAIAESKGEFKIAGEWEMEGIESVYPVEKGQTVYSTDVDSFMKDKEGKVGFIKADVQGIMHKAVNGMKETIQKDRPVLLLDVSDSPEDLFYTKPMLEDIVKDLNYTIKITNFNSGYCIVGTSLWAYPKELDE